VPEEELFGELGERYYRMMLRSYPALAVPTSQLTWNSGADMGRLRGSVPNGTDASTSAVRARGSGRASASPSTCHETRPTAGGGPAPRRPHDYVRRRRLYLDQQLRGC
jgi:hypothetical protein